MLAFQFRMVLTWTQRFSTRFFGLIMVLFLLKSQKMVLSTPVTKSVYQVLVFLFQAIPDAPRTEDTSDHV